MYYYRTQNQTTGDFEPKTLPTMNDIVFCEATHFSGLNTYFKLIEYNNNEGFVPITELDKKVKDPEKQFKIGMTYPMIVTGHRQINDEKWSVDLSYKKVQKETRQDLLSKFTNINKLYTIINEFCFFTKVEFNIAQKLIMYPKFDMNSQQYLSDAESLYKNYLKNPSDFFGNIEELKNEIEMFVENVKSRITITKMIVNQQFRLWVLQNNSLDILKHVLSYVSDGCEIEYISSPKYQFVIKCEDDNEHKIFLNKFLDYMTEQQKIYKLKFELDEEIVIKNQEFLLKPLNMIGSN